MYSVATETKHRNLEVISKPLWKTIGNEQKVTLKDHDLSVVVFGYLPEIKERTPINVVIQRPDGSTESLSILTKKMANITPLHTSQKKWQKGTFHVTTGAWGARN